MNKMKLFNKLIEPKKFRDLTTATIEVIVVLFYYYLFLLLLCMR